MIALLAFRVPLRSASAMEVDAVLSPPASLEVVRVSVFELSEDVSFWNQSKSELCRTATEAAMSELRALRVEEPRTHLASIIVRSLNFPTFCFS